MKDYFLTCDDYVFQFKVNYNVESVANLCKKLYVDFFVALDQGLITNEVEYQNKIELFNMIYNFVNFNDMSVLDYDGNEDNKEDLNIFRSFLKLEFVKKISMVDYLYNGSNKVR